MSTTIRNETYTGEHSNYFSMYPFELSDFQKWAIDAFLNRKHSLVTAHTGSGKTLPAEFAIDYVSKNTNKKIIYTSPIKSLSNQKFYEFKQKFPHANIGILTGDIKYNPDGNVLIMTTEILRNLLFNGKINDISKKIDIHLDINNDIHTVVFDEIHYINDVDRGRVWEETIILLPKHIQMIMLSATIDAPEHFANWIAGIKEVDVVLAGNSQRVVPLRHSVFTHYLPSYINKHKEVASDLLELQAKPVIFSDEHDKFKEVVYRKAVNTIDKSSDGFSKNIYNEVINYLSEYCLTPSLFFCFSRKRCETLATSVDMTMLTSLQSNEVEKTIDYYIRKSEHGDKYKELDQFIALQKCLVKGVAFHHSGLLAIFKEIIELLYSKNLVKVLFATETFAVGVNMPTKTVIFTSLEKPTASGLRPLYTHEYLQMAGRAGRRGIDKEGLVMILPTNGLPEPNAMKHLICGSPQLIQSKFVPNYQLILKIILNELPIEKITGYSLLQVENQDQIAKLKTELDMANTSVPSTDFKLAVEYSRLVSNNGVRIPQGQAKRNAKRAEEIAKTPGFNTIYNEYLICREDLEHRNKLERELIGLDGFIQFQIDKTLTILEKYGYITQNSYKVEKQHVTTKGIVASEINECNELLLTELLFGHYIDTIDYRYLASVLSLFCDTKPISKESLVGYESQTAYECEGIVKFIENFAADLAYLEQVEKLDTNSDWDINTYMMDPIYEWVDCNTSFQDIVKNYDIYEGNFIKDCIRIYNLSGELENAAKKIEKNHLAIQCSKVRDVILRDIVNMESLYIKL
jgi:superfamily II RNA helicase